RRPCTGARRKPVRRVTWAQNRPASGATSLSAYATTVPGRKANPCPSPASNRAGAGMTAWSIRPESLSAVRQAQLRLTERGRQRGHRRVGRDLGGQRVGMRPVDVAQGDAVVGDLRVVPGGLELAGRLL